MKKTISMTAMMMALASPSYAFEDGKLVIWTGANRDQDALVAAVQPFVDDLGVEVVVEIVDPDLPQKYQQAAATGDGPDIVLWAHDRFGEWANGGLIAPVQPSATWAEGILPSAMGAVQFGGKTWGYPMSVEAVTLVYNTDLVPTPPASFEEIAAMELDGSKILWDYNNTYFTMPMLMAGGGYAFQKVDGNYDGSSTGVNTDGAIAGAEVLKSLFDDNVMPQGVDYGVMDGAMKNGEVAMVLNGPWSWAGFEEAGINYAVAPIPTVNGEVSPPFLGVVAFGINAATLISR